MLVGKSDQQKLSANMTSQNRTRTDRCRWLSPTLCNEDASTLCKEATSILYWNLKQLQSGNMKQLQSGNLKWLQSKNKNLIQSRNLKQLQSVNLIPKAASILKPKQALTLKPEVSSIPPCRSSIKGLYDEGTSILYWILKWLPSGNMKWLQSEYLKRLQSWNRNRPSLQIHYKSLGEPVRCQSRQVLSVPLWVLGPRRSIQ